jgi:hypothetical protein
VPTYGWPVKPFHRPHPVRGYFNDPRISGSSRTFHFGVDICAADGTPVYAVEGGTAHRSASSIAVVASGGRTFGYWHVVPAVRHRQTVRPRQLLGHVEAPWAHVHFAESFRKRYRNPLRPGALGPWIDPTSPRIAGVHFVRAGTQRELSPLQVDGLVDVIVEAFDRPPLPVPPPWNDVPVTPAVLRWRVLKANRVVRPWQAPVDHRRGLIPRELFGAVFAPGTQQNRPNKPGRYRFYMARRWNTRRLANGLYRAQVAASDARGNRAQVTLPFTVRNTR